MASIFDRSRRLKPSQLRTVADRRYADARALCDTEKNAHANGAQYLGGFVLEMLLKAQLIEKYPHTASRQSHEPMAAEERQVWSLIYRSHDLEEMLDHLAELEGAIQKAGERDGRSYLAYLRELCGAWTIYARYSPLSTTIVDARAFLDRVRELKELLK